MNEHAVVTRSDGYEAARGKEDPALAVARDCIRAVLELDAVLIQDPDLNRRRGDLSALRGTAECKGQGVDPGRFRRNFVEVFEDVSALKNPKHADGLARTAEILSMSADALARAPYIDHRDPARPRRTVGTLAYVSASLESIAGSDITIYANPDPARTFVYFYTRGYLLQAIREAIAAGELVRGMGRSNEDTFGVLVNNSPARWQRREGTWVFCGEGKPPIDRIREAFRGDERVKRHEGVG